MSGICYDFDLRKKCDLFFTHVETFFPEMIKKSNQSHDNYTKRKKKKKK